VTEERGEGAGSPSPAHQSRYFYFHSPDMVNLNVLYDITIFAFYTERINSKSITILLLGEKNCYKEGVRGLSPPAPVEGRFA
jgi:hypothetical protein